MLIKNRPEGSDITIMNTMYSYGKKIVTYDETKGKAVEKYDKGSITITYKDNITGRKYHEYIEDPDYEYYIMRGELLPHNQLFMDKDRLEKVSVPFRELEKSIAESSGNKELYYNNIKSGNRYANKRFHQYPNVFRSDTHIEDHYRYRFGKQYTNNTDRPISKAYIDIEADTKYARGDFPELGECPINAVTIIDEAKDQVYTFLLRDKNNPLIGGFERTLNKNTFDRLREFVRNAIGGRKNEIRYGLDRLNYNILFYDQEEEINMLVDLFRYINTSQPDFVLAWNMAFDIPYIIERIKKLGYNPEDVMCHPDFEVKKATYYIDERNKNEFAERGDFATISSYSVYLDQMIHFASRRKGQSQFMSFGLDYIGSTVAGVHKLDYKDITTDLGELPYLNYEVFVFYNIMDTIVQKCIEAKTEDIDYVFNKCIANNTRYQKCHRQTVYLTNRGAKEFEEEGFIIGNNNNKFNEKPKEKFPGAFVGDPLKVSDYAKIKEGTQVFLVFDNLDDFDFASLYPSILRQFNIAPNTQIGMIIIPNQIYAGENPSGDEKFSRGGKFLEDMHSGDYLEFCSRWFKLADYGDLYKDVIEYFNNVADCARQLRSHTPEGNIIPYDIKKKDTFTPYTYIGDLITPYLKFRARSKK